MFELSVPKAFAPVPLKLRLTCQVPLVFSDALADFSISPVTVDLSSAYFSPW